MAFYWINDLFWRIIFILQWIICQPNVHRSREAWRSLKFTLANIHLSRSQGESWTNATWVFWVYFCYLDKYWLKWTCGLLRFPLTARQSSMNSKVCYTAGSSVTVGTPDTLSETGSLKSGRSRRNGCSFNNRSLRTFFIDIRLANI